MTLNEIEQRLDALQAEKDKLTAELERLKSEEQSKEVKPWRAEYNLLYYTIMGNGNTHSFTGNYDVADNAYFRIGNYYRTRELAEQDAKELALRGRVRQLRDALCEGYQFKYGRENYCIQHDGMFGKFSVECTDINSAVAEIFFDTEEHAQTACDILNAEAHNGT